MARCASGVKEDRGEPPRAHHESLAPWRLAGEEKRGALHFPGSPADLLLDIPGFENALGSKPYPTPRHVLSILCLWPCLPLLVEWGAGQKNCLMLIPGSILSETALGCFISTPCENTGNPASPILKYLPQEGRYIVFPGPLFCL